MIERLQRIATILARFRLPIFMLAGFSFVVLVLSVLNNPLLDNDGALDARYPRVLLGADAV